MFLISDMERFTSPYQLTAPADPGTPLRATQAPLREPLASYRNDFAGPHRDDKKKRKVSFTSAKIDPISGRPWESFSPLGSLFLRMFPIVFLEVKAMKSMTVPHGDTMSTFPKQTMFDNLLKMFEYLKRKRSESAWEDRGKVEGIQMCLSPIAASIISPNMNAAVSRCLLN